MSSKNNIPSFSIVSMATICSKMGCGASRLSGNASLVDRPDGTGDIMAQRPRLPADITTRANAERLVVFSPSLQKVFEFSESGAFLLRIVDGEKTVGELTSLFEKKYGTLAGEASAGVAGFFLALQQVGFELALE